MMPSPEEKDRQDPEKQTPYLTKKKRPLWSKICWILTGIWIIYAVSVSKGNLEHPIMNYIFTAPLLGWVVIAVIVSFFQWRKMQKDKQKL